MRPVLHSDLDHCVRVLLARPDGEWGAVMDRVTEGAHLADVMRKRGCRALAHLGDGSLAGATGLYDKAPLPALCDARYCAALAAVLDGIKRWRGRPPSN